MAHFDELMQRALTVRNNVAPSSNTAILVGGVLVSIVSALQLLLDTKQGTLTFDNEPTDGSTNPVTSNGIYDAIIDAIASIDLSACEKIVNKVTAIDAQSTDVQYPSAKLLYDSLQNLATVYAAIVHTHTASQITDLTTVLSVYELLSNKVAAVDEQSTDDQYPTAKLFYDTLQLTDAYLANLDARVTSLENDPPVTYIISGTSSKTNDSETFIVQFIAKGASVPSPAQTITVETDANGIFLLKYVNKKIVSLNNFATNNQTLVNVDFSRADDFSELKGIGTYTGGGFEGCTSLVSVTFGSGHIYGLLTGFTRAFMGCTNLVAVDVANINLNSVNALTNAFYGCASLQTLDFGFNTIESAVSCYRAFRECTALTSVNFAYATFENVTDAAQMFYNDFSLTNLDLSRATFASLNSFDLIFGFTAIRNLSMPAALFNGAYNHTAIDNGSFGVMDELETIDLSSATFANAVALASLFRGKPKLTSINLPSATFATVTNIRTMFTGCGVNGITINMPLATFANVTRADNLFNRVNRAYGNIASINMPSATFASLPDGEATNMFANNTLLTTINVPSSGTLNSTLSLASNNLLSYASILNVAYWLKDLTNAAAKTLTINTTAWNALTAAEQSNIDTILSGKNWTRVLA